MLNLKELERIKRVLDFSVDSDDDDIILIRIKISEMIALEETLLVIRSSLKDYVKHRRIQQIMDKMVV